MVGRKFLYSTSYIMMAWMTAHAVAAEPPAYATTVAGQEERGQLPQTFSPLEIVKIRHLETGEEKRVLVSNSLIQAVVTGQKSGCFRRIKFYIERHPQLPPPACGGYVRTWISRGSDTLFGCSLVGGESGTEILSVVPDSPAEQRGLFPGDRIIAINNIWVGALSFEEASHYLRNVTGNRVELVLHRGSTAPEPLFPSVESTQEGIQNVQIRIENPDSLWAMMIGTTPIDAEGFYAHGILKVTPNGHAEKAGCRVGDELMTVNGQEARVLDHDAVVALFTKSRLQGEFITLTVSRPVDEP